MNNEMIMFILIAKFKMEAGREGWVALSLFSL